MEQLDSNTLSLTTIMKDEVDKDSVDYLLPPAPPEPKLEGVWRLVRIDERDKKTNQLATTMTWVWDSISLPSVFSGGSGYRWQIKSNLDSNSWIYPETLPKSPASNAALQTLSNFNRSPRNKNHICFLIFLYYGRETRK
ncbi:hypothetical protein P5673_023328 [Acropora cervicornis]|uniref:Uncharacterized protein n=1 Tax=Acropora cervicornis TaxID=6130 RepID=A0AAD9Q596_ACRCE|nr:hypothetical protein P5673_023328 [Acropora cervicornis]